MMSDNNLILHKLHFTTTHFSFITVHLCSDNLLLYVGAWKETTHAWNIESLINNIHLIW